MSILSLITTGKPFIKAIESAGAVGINIPLEGGHEGRYQRRVRAAGYSVLNLSARGLGDLSSYLMGVHGVRPPHLGKKTSGREGAVGYTYFIPPIAKLQLDSLPPQSKGLVLWLMEGMILSEQELQYLISLPKVEPQIKVVAEMGGGRSFRWKPLTEFVIAA